MAFRLESRSFPFGSLRVRMTTLLGVTSVRRTTVLGVTTPLRMTALGLCLGAGCSALVAQGAPAKHTVVFEQAGFPTVASEPVPHAALVAALGPSASFADLAALRSGRVLEEASLLVLPYGSAVPVAAWSQIEHFLHGGGNLLILGGQPLRVPVLGEATGGFTQKPAQDSYSRLLDLRHTYAVPLRDAPARFNWREGYEFLPRLSLRPRAVFAEEGRLNGLAYLDAADGTHLAAPVIWSDHPVGSPLPGSRMVALPFTPEPGYWESADGTRLIATCARYAATGATSLSVEVQYAAIRPGELPQVTVHLHGGPGYTGESSGKIAGTVQVELHRGPDPGGKVLEKLTLPLHAEDSVPVPIRTATREGVYTITATWAPTGAEQPFESAENGFVVEDVRALEQGAALGTHGDFLSLGGKPFFPVGTNYFSTEANGWDFSGPRNAAVWEHDFADMQRHGVNFVRTGVWGGYGKFIEPSTGGVNERFLRNLEAYLSAAHRHDIAVNFTFFAFSPHTNDARPQQGGNPDAGPTPPNPYLDPGQVRAEQGYLLSVVNRFGRIPWLCYDLIN